MSGCRRWDRTGGCGLKSAAQCHRAILSVGNLQPVEVGEELAVSCSELGCEVAWNDVFGFSIQHAGRLLKLAARLPESARCLVAHDTTVSGNPLQSQSVIILRCIGECMSFEASLRLLFATNKLI